MRTRPGIRCAVAAALLTACTVAVAAPETLSVQLRAGAGYSDNVQRSSTGEVSSATYAVGGNVEYREVTRRLDANVVADLDYVFYEEAGADDELVGNLDAGLRFGIVPDKFFWTIDNSYGQGRFNLTQPSSPQNTEGINFFSTGPDLLLRMSTRDYLQFFARYANAWYEESEGDSDQYGGGVTAGRQLDPNTRVSVTANFNRIEYDQETFPEIDSMQYFATYSTQGARTSISLDAGYRTIDNGDGSDGGPLLRAKIDRELSDYGSVFAFANYEYSDRAASLNGDLSRPPGSPPGNDVFAGGGIYEELAGGIGARYVRSRTSLGASLSYRDQDYLESDDNDVERTEIDASIERQLGPRWSAGLRGRLWRENLTATDNDSREASGGIFARWRSARAFGAEAEWQYWERSSDFGDADENRVWLRATWQPIDRGN